MTSLFSRLQKLNKDGPWSIREDGGELDVLDAEGCPVAHADLGWPGSRQNVFAMVECRNSLPAVLNLIEATVGLDDVIQWIAAEYPAAMVAMPTDLFRRLGTAGEAVAVFVSGQEELQ